MKTISNHLLNWYDQHGRTLPWRAKGKQKPDPYHVWISEIMLQQTTVAAVIPYFLSFTKRWPTIKDFSKASLDDVLHAWQGLGYYSRARNLHKAAGIITDKFKGQLPNAETDLLSLPGLGPYTSAAVSAIAFNQVSAPVDGNIERVIARLFCIAGLNPQLKKDVTAKLKPLVPNDRPGDFIQALMDLGATVCLPENPKCDICPLQKNCRAFQTNRVKDFPTKKTKAKIPVRKTIVFWVEDKNGNVLIRKRPEKGLLASMMEIPSSAWSTDFNLEKALKEAPLKLNYKLQPGTLRHTFTHFHLDMQIATAETKSKQKGLWVHPKDFQDYAFPNLMKKIIKASTKI